MSKTSLRQQLEDYEELVAEGEESLVERDREDVEAGEFGEVFGVRLTVGQVTFVEEYSLHGNATLAAERAGYKGSRKQLTVVGTRLKRNKNVRRALDAFWAARRKRYPRCEDTAVAMIMESFAEARDAGQCAAMVAAAKAYAETLGMLDRNRNQVSKFAMVTDAELADQAAAVMKKLGRRMEPTMLIEVMQSGDLIDVDAQEIEVG